MIYAFGNFELDEERVELRRGGDPVDLQPKPLRLLFHLVRNRERNVDKDELFERVWPNVVVSESALSTALRDARRALGDDGKKPRLIETRRGMGYRFIASVEEREETGHRPPNRSMELTSAGPARATPGVFGRDHPDGPAPGGIAPGEPQPTRSRSYEADRPGIAVLPFDCFGREEEDGYLADGLAEDLITRLANTLLRVVARTSSFAYRGDQRDVREIGQELEVRYIIEGSVRRSGERLRVTVQLIDVDTGKHVWAERYDRAIGDVFDLQDEVIGALVRSMSIQLKAHLGTEAVRKGPGSPAALDAFWRSSWHSTHSDPANVDKGIAAAQRAVEIDPEFAEAWAGLSLARSRAVLLLQRQPPRPTVAAALLEARRAIELAPRLYAGQLAMGFALHLDGELGRAEEALGRAIEIEPDIPDAHALLGLILAHSAEPERAFEPLERSLRLYPKAYAASGPLTYRAIALFSLGRDQEALDQLDDSLQVYQDVLQYPLRAAILAHLGRGEEARDQLTALPPFRLSQIERLVERWDERVLGRYLDGLRIAGVPE